MAVVCKFTFPEHVERDVVETQMTLAIIAAECRFGQARVRISAAYSISADARQIVIDVSTEVGEHIAEVFTGLMIRQLGEEEFAVERVEGTDREVTAEP